MRWLVSIWVFGLVSVAFGQTPSRSLAEGEYFWDTDPGQGSGTPITAKDSAWDETIETLFTSGIAVPSTPGPHTFNVRVKAVDGVWSSVFTTVVNVPVDTTETTQALREMKVVQAEYFWDADPGQGAGTPLLALDGALDETLETAFANGIPAPAAAGPHSFNVRVKDVDGNWSAVFKTIVNIPVDTTETTQGLRDMKITQAEYFWDTDPGQGSGTALLAFDGALDETLETVLANGIAAPATLGPHSFNVRVKDVDGTWSAVFSTIVFLETDPTQVVNDLRDMEITQAEYFWNTDPGQGSGTPILALDGALDETLETLFQAGLSTPGTAGTHSFNLRVKDVDGNWSALFTTVVELVDTTSTTTALRDMEVVQAEYFWNTDPGQGSGTPILALDGALDETLETLFQAGLSTPGTAGTHSFNLRVKDVDGNWSPLFTTVVELVDPTTTVTALRDMAVIQAEYFWNADPGQGAGSPILALDGALDEALESVFANGIATPAAAGQHTFNVRVKDVDGNWAPVFTTVVDLTDPTQTVNQLRKMELIQAEYFWNVDPGFGAATPLVATDGAFDETLEKLARLGIPTPGVYGPHSFNVRVRDFDGNWSPLFTTIVYLGGPGQGQNPNYQTDNDGDGFNELMEEFFGTDGNRFDDYDEHVKASFENGHLTIEIERRAAAAGLSLEVELSNDLETWRSAADGWVELLEETSTRLRFRATRSTTEEPRLFYRFVVSRENS